MAVVNALGHFFFHWRNALFPALLVAVAIVFPPTPYTAPAAGVALVAGFVTLVLGQGLRVVTIGLDYIQRGGKNGRIHASRLVTGGIFSHCRNPMYTGNVLMAFGFLLIAGNAAGVIFGGLLACVVYAAIIQSEETFLEAAFSDNYRDYCRRVPRWIPRPDGLPCTLTAHRFDWAAVVIREYGTLFTTALIVLALLAWKAWLSGDLDSVGPACLMLFAVCLVAYAVARYLKKTRRLRPLHR